MAKVLIPLPDKDFDTTEVSVPWHQVTEAGLVELRAMIANRRLTDPKRFAHVRQELGIDPVSATDPAQE